MALPEPGTGAARTVRSRRETLLRVAADLIATSGYSRASLRDVADAAGIQAGSIYHHFPSKEMLAVELVAAFHAELDDVAWDGGSAPADPVEAVQDFAQRVAVVAGRHRAAVHLCMYDAPSTAGEALSNIVRRRPESIDRRWDSLLRTAAGQERLRPEADPTLLNAVLRESVLDLVKLPGEHHLPQLVASLTDLLLSGLATDVPPDPALDASPAAVTARTVIGGWADPDAPPGPKRRAEILAAARHEFARRGYEATTVRDIAEAAGMRASSLYRHFDSKQAMVSAIIGHFSRALLDAFEAVTDSRASATEELDAILVVMCSASRHFRLEFRIMRAWWRSLASELPDQVLAENAARLAVLEGIVQRGVAAGEFHPPAHPSLLPLALRDVIWTQLQEVAAVSTAEHLTFLRTCVLRGAALPAAV